ncbi:unnamed protein product [Lampetra planeri]
MILATGQTFVKPSSHGATQSDGCYSLANDDRLGAGFSDKPRRLFSVSPGTRRRTTHRAQHPVRYRTRRPGTDRHARRHANLDATWNAIGGGAAPGARHNPPCDVALAKSDPRKNHIGRDTRYCARSDL